MVDLEMQISLDSIRQGLYNCEDTMRCLDVAMGKALGDEITEAVRLDREFTGDQGMWRRTRRGRGRTYGDFCPGEQIGGE